MADLVLFVGSRSPYQFDILASPLFSACPDKCLVFDLNDNAIPLIPGIYMGIPPSLHTVAVYRYGFYMRVFDNGVLSENAPHDRCRYLFSFVGKADNAPSVRNAILGLDIVSDDWRPPPGPRWNDFAVVIPEKEVGGIPGKLATLERQAEAMGARAWAEWRRHFALDTAFTWIGDTLEGIQESRASCRAVVQRRRLREALRSRIHRRPFLGECARQVAALFTRRRGAGLP
jgi:hypothetical protein